MKKLLAICIILCMLLSGCGAEAPESEGPIHLTLGCLYLDGTGVGPVIQEFNKSQDRIIVEVKEYLELTDTFDQAETKLTTEILAGDPPDIIFFPQLRMDGEATYNRFSPLPIIAKGLLLDMDTFIEEDAELKPENFSAWNALHEYGGLYLLSNSYTLQSATCTQEFYDQNKGWTFQDFLEIEKTMKPGQRMFTSIDPYFLLFSIGTRYLHGAIDMKNATCHFDIPEFISILETVQNVEPVEFEFSMDRPAQVQLLEGVFLIGNTHLYSPNDIAFDRARARGEQLAYIGWPTTDGNSGTEMQLLGAMGISAGTEHPAACWELVRYYVTNWTYQADEDGAPATWEGYGTPVYRPELPKCIEVDTEYGYRFGTDITQEDIDLFLDTTEQCDRMNYYDATVMDLIMEEAEEMMKGNATPEQTAKNIQDRVSLYMQEQYG